MPIVTSCLRTMLKRQKRIRHPQRTSKDKLMEAIVSYALSKTSRLWLNETIKRVGKSLPITVHFLLEFSLDMI